MLDSLKRLKVRFNDTSQARSKKTLDDLLEAAEKIAASGNPTLFDARTLSKESGYSLGSLVKRLGKIDSVFLYAIALGRSKQISEIEKKLDALDSDVEPKQFVEALTDLAFKGIEKVNPGVIRYYENRALNRSGNLAAVYSYTEEIIDPLLRLIGSNRSGKFRKIDRNEARYICRAMFLFIERPYVEDDQIAGTSAHRKIVIDNITRLLQHDGLLEK